MSNQELHSRSRLAGYTPEVLFDAVALVVGVGALGQNLALDLALAGIGEIDIVDFDEFEPHNATRSPLYPSHDEQVRWGLGKAKVVANKLFSHMTAPTPVIRYATTPVQALGNLPLRRANVVFAAVDNSSARSFLGIHCHITKRPLFEGGFRGETLNLTVFGPKYTDACYCCVDSTVESAYSCKEYALQAEAAHIIPAIQNTATVLAGLQAEAGIQWLHGVHARDGQRIYANIREATMKVVGISRFPRCPGFHHDVPIDPLPIAISGSDTIATLLARIKELAGEATVALPAQFAMRIACKKCNRLAEPRVPVWKWRLSPLCVDCGGPFALAREGRSINSYDKLDTEKHINDEIGDITCIVAGLPPGTTFEVIPSTPNSVVGAYSLFRLQGDISDLMTSL